MGEIGIGFLIGLVLVRFGVEFCCPTCMGVWDSKVFRFEGFRVPVMEGLHHCWLL